MSCTCDLFQPLELFRDAITERIRQTRRIRHGKQLNAENKEHKLYQCETCDQMCQISRAWNWGNYRYAFKVPTIDRDDWLVEPYVQPDKLLIYQASIDCFFDKNRFVDTERVCKGEHCEASAVEHSVFCLRHHVMSLKSTGVLPVTPTGRWFDPYIML